MFDITQEEEYRELTLEEQYLVNGGKEIENSIAAQADASVGDTVTDSNGKTSTLTQGDINWAQKVMAERNGGSGNSGADSGSPSYGPSGPNSSSPSKHTSIHFPSIVSGSISMLCFLLKICSASFQYLAQIITS